MRYLKLISFCFLVALSLVSCGEKKTGKTNTTDTFEGTKPKYVFMFIGDGLGITQSNAAEAYLAAVKGKKGVEKLVMNTFPVTGFYTTYSASQLITDSAAGGTALATGEKTSNGTVSMDETHTKDFETVGEVAHQKGKKVGVVTSVSIDHATPACFYAHQPSRNMYYEISSELGTSGFNYFAGGGMKDPDGKKKENTKNTYDIAKENGYTVINTRKTFDALPNSADKVYAYAERLAGGASMPYEIDRKATDMTLAEFTEKGAELMKGDQGFFMMVESGKIDWACHANDAATTIHEVLILNNAVKKAVEFYNQHPNETLIIVCGDHETGGMGLGFAGKKYESGFAVLANQKVSYETFAQMIKEYCEDDRANFRGAMQLVTQNFGLGRADLGLELTDLEIEKLKNAFEQSKMQEKQRNKDEEYYLLYGSYDPLTLTACHILAQKAGIGWTTFSHTATPIPIRAMGVGQELFEGYYDNTDVAKKVKELL